MGEKITILLPVKDIVWPLMKRCVKSIIRQSYDNFEVIVKATHEAEYVRLYDYFKKLGDDRFKLVLCCDSSVTQAGNQALKFATGDLITLFCHDDIYLPDAFETLIRKLDNSMWYYGKINYYKADGFWVQISYLTDPVLEHMKENNVIPQPACFFRRQAMNEVGLFDEQFRLCWDYDYWIRLMKKFKPKFINAFFANYYLNGNSISVKMNDRMDFEKKLVYGKHFTDHGKE